MHLGHPGQLGEVSVHNIISFHLLTAGATESLNVRGAYLEVLADIIGSVGVIIAAGIIFLTGWPYADTVIGLFILPRKHGVTHTTIQCEPAGHLEPENPV